MISLIKDKYQESYRGNQDSLEWSKWNSFRGKLGNREAGIGTVQKHMSPSLSA